MSQNYTTEQMKFMVETYGRILTPQEWAERQKRFNTDASEVYYDKDGIMCIGGRGGPGT